MNQPGSPLGKERYETRFIYQPAEGRGGRGRVRPWYLAGAAAGIRTDRRAGLRGDAECLRRIRDQRLYKSKTPSARYVGASKTQVDRVIRQLEEFGAEFFQLTQLTRISPETYRAIAGQVSQEGLRFEGEMIALVPENAEKVAAAVAELRRRKGRLSEPGEAL